MQAAAQKFLRLEFSCRLKSNARPSRKFSLSLRTVSDAAYPERRRKIPQPLRKSQKDAKISAKGIRAARGTRKARKNITKFGNAHFYSPKCIYSELNAAPSERKQHHRLPLPPPGQWRAGVVKPAAGLRSRQKKMARGPLFIEQMQPAETRNGRPLYLAGAVESALP